MQTKLNKNVIWSEIMTLFLSASPGTVKKEQELIQLHLNNMFPGNIDRQNKPFFILIKLSVSLQM